MINVNLIGNLVKEIEVQQTANNKSYVNNKLACRTAAGETEFVHIKVWGKATEILSKYCKKGSRIALSGELRSFELERDDGEKRTYWEVVASSMELLNSKSDGDGAPKRPKADELKEEEVSDEDMPF